MAQEAAFTSSAMTTALENSSVSYEDLAEIERQFDDAETEIIRQQVALTAPLYKKRAELLSKIDNFWPLVLEQAPPDIDQYIQPSDSALLLSSLNSLSVDNFEITGAVKGGNPRSISIKLEFAENEHFEDKVLEKKFWYRSARDGWSGLVSEPVKIHWKKDKDLTGGLLDLVIKAWEAEQASNGARTTGYGPSNAQKALQKKIESTGMGGLSFFSWFGFIGRRVTAEMSNEAIKHEAAKRRGEKVEADKPVTEEQEDQEDLEMSLEIFPDGDDLAVAIAEDLWPGAIKYFTQAQEQDALSDVDFESDEEGDDDEAGSFEGLSDNEAPPAKKRRS